MTKALEKRQQKAKDESTALVFLQKLLDKGDKIQCMQTGRTSNGTKFYQVFAIRGGDLVNITWATSRLIDARLSESRQDAIIMTGSGYNAAQEIAERLSYSVFGDAYDLKYCQHIV